MGVCYWLVKHSKQELFDFGKLWTIHDVFPADKPFTIRGLFPSTPELARALELADIRAYGCSLNCYVNAQRITEWAGDDVLSLLPDTRATEEYDYRECGSVFSEDYVDGVFARDDDD